MANKNKKVNQCTRVVMSSTLAAGSNYRCAPSETEVSDLDIDEGPQAGLDPESSSDSKTADTNSSLDRLPRFTRDQLLAYDGQTLGQPIYVALLGNVYDVSAGRKFYGPGIIATLIHCVSEKLGPFVFLE